jgi:hypothetical protein
MGATAMEDLDGSSLGGRDRRHVHQGDQFIGRFTRVTVEFDHSVSAVEGAFVNLLDYLCMNCEGTDRVRIPLRRRRAATEFLAQTCDGTEHDDGRIVC